MANSSTTYCTSSDCYTLNVVALSFPDADAKCTSDGGSLWAPQSSTEAFAVETWFGLLSQRGGIYIGVKRASSASAWVQATGAAQSYTHW